MNKDQLKFLIKEVIREAEEMTAGDPEANSGEEPKGSPDSMKHSAAVDKKHGDTMMTFTLRGLKPGKRYKEILAKMAYDAKQADLDVIHAEINKGGKPIDSMDIGELKANQPDDENDKFDTSPTKSITRTTSKEKPPMQGSPEDWESMGGRDMDATRAKTKLKQSKIASGTYDPNDTSLWTDHEWDAWEAQQRQKDPKSWAAFDAFLKAKQKV